jgi:hypothetical protein
MVDLSPWQRLVAETYGDGDYAHVATLAECRDVGDTLFTFLMIELDPKEDCGDWIEAVRRVEQAQDQLEELMDQFRKRAPYLTERGRTEHINAALAPQADAP